MNPIRVLTRAEVDVINTAAGGSGQPAGVTLPPVVVRRIAADMEAMTTAADRLKRHSPVIKGPCPSARQWQPRPLAVAHREAPKTWARNLSEGVALGVCLVLYCGACSLLAGR